MSQLIEVTDKSGGQTVLVNADHILSVHTMGEPPYTVITFAGGSTRICRETPADIMTRIARHG